MYFHLKISGIATARFGLTLALLLGANRSTFAQPTATNQSWAYLLVSDSYLLDDCPVCDRVSIPEPLRGSFQMRLLDRNPLVSRYAIEAIDFKAVSPRAYAIKGTGTYEIGGEVAVLERMFLQIEIDDGVSTKLCFLTNSPAPPGRLAPMLDVTLTQTNGTIGQVYTLRLAAAPVREVWFSATSSFTAGAGPSASNTVRGGDLISSTGRVVKRNSDLFTSVGAFPPTPDLGLDAVDILPGGEVAFSLGVDITSTTLGPLHHGDLLSNKGRILKCNADLLAPFQPQPATGDAGLDAVHILGGGEILFSIGTDVFSERLGVTLRRGDLLSSTGSVARTNPQLLAQFHPPKDTNDYGLDAIYVWTSGELWFSTEQGFQDQVLGAIQPGDLLSDQGYIVLRNSELLAAFAPVELAPDFGLDALYLITDATPPAPPPRLGIALVGRTPHLTWQAQGRVFQVERGNRLPGPFQPLSSIIPDLSFDDSAAPPDASPGCYRLRQW